MGARKSRWRNTIRIDDIDKRGPGGSRRSKKHTGVRVVDTDTGVIAIATERRHWPENLRIALQRLAEKRLCRETKQVPRTRITPPEGRREDKQTRSARLVARRFELSTDWGNE